MHSFFVAGTDTGAGKTRITSALIQAFKQKGLSVAGMKPVATGCINTEDGLRNPDAVAIQSCSATAVSYNIVNPYAFEPAIAPLFAADAVKVNIEAETICNAFSELSEQADIVIVEGIGGWRIPLGPGLQMADLARVLQLQIILVVGLRVGCINHALLSIEAIANDGVKLAGWVANQIDPDYRNIDQTVNLIADACDAPLLGVVPYRASCNNIETASCLYSDRLDILAG